jgi:hypothetical protein
MPHEAMHPVRTNKAVRRVGVFLAVGGLVVALSEASVETRSITSGLQKETSTSIKVSLETGFSAPDSAALVDYLLGVAWSSETKQADKVLRIHVLSDPQVSIVDALEAAGWASTSGNPNTPERAVVDAAEVKDRFGNWPGEVPVLPDGLIVGPTPEPTP